MTYLTLGDLFAMVERTFGTTRMVRDPDLLDASAYRPRATMSGDDLYPTINLKAAELMESLVCNQPLIDGNKRFGFAATVVFYGLNGWCLQHPGGMRLSISCSGWRRARWSCTGSPAAWSHGRGPGHERLYLHLCDRGERLRALITKWAERSLPA